MYIKNIILLSVVLIVISSCAAKKNLAKANDYNASLEAQLDSCRSKMPLLEQQLRFANETKLLLEDQVRTLTNTNNVLLNNIGDLATLSKKEAENLERSLESLQEKDMQITALRDAVTKKDSVTLALVTSLKGALGNMNDEDIEISVEKGVVYVSISDKLLFSSGSYSLSKNARVVLGKVATVLKNKPNIEFLVEGHTDNQTVNTTASYKDNWELSVLRATSVVRLLQEDFGIAPERMTAAGRSYYVPVADNTTSEGRSKNRRTRIVIIPKLDQFFGLIEDGMNEAEK